MRDLRGTETGGEWGHKRKKKTRPTPMVKKRISDFNNFEDLAN